MNNDNFTVLVSAGDTLLDEHVHCVALTFKIAEQIEQRICIKFCVKLETLPSGNYLGDSEGFGGQCNECSTNKSVAQMLQRWSRIC